ncbi:MAG: hypothetical protein P1U56_22220 [Saprospiraceae bacterium]|nr:hypothetical protein [Saprospiraceae bacterium]
MDLKIHKYIEQLDKWLLVNYPTVWRTGVLYFFIYSFILSNVVLYSLGQLLRVEITNFYTTDQIITFWGVLILLGSFVILYWISIISKRRLININFKQLLITYLLYVFCVGSIILNTIVFTLPVISKTSNLLDDYNLDDVLSFHTRNNFWVGEKSVRLFQEDEEVQTIVKRHLAYFKLDPKFKIGYSSNRDIHVCLSRYVDISSSLEEPRKFKANYFNDTLVFEKSIITKCFRRVNTEIENNIVEVFFPNEKSTKLEQHSLTTAKSDIYLLKAKLETIENCKNFLNGKGSVFDVLFIRLPICFTLFLPLVFLLFVSRHFINNSLSGIKRCKDIFKRIFMEREWITKLDRKLAIKFPIIWSSKIFTFWTKYLGYQFIVTLSICCFAFVVSNSSTYQRLDHEILFLVGLMFYFLIFVLLLIGSIPWVKLVGHSTQSNHSFYESLKLFYLLILSNIVYVLFFMSFSFLLLDFKKDDGFYFIAPVLMTLYLAVFGYMCKILGSKFTPILVLFFATVINYIVLFFISNVLGSFEMNENIVAVLYLLFPIIILVLNKVSVKNVGIRKWVSMFLFTSLPYLVSLILVIVQDKIEDVEVNFVLQRLLQIGSIIVVLASVIPLFVRGVFNVNAIPEP